MPKLPQAADFGARPSLRSNRVDMPGNADIATGEALSRAASAFSTIVGEKKQKTDRLNYALAKNDLLRADIENREKLKDDEDYETYDQRYSDGYNTARDDVYTKYNLTADDGAILDAESDLIRERGRVQVGDASRKVKRDNEQTAVESNLLTAREEILSLDPASANELMLNQLDAIQGAVDASIYTDAEGLALSQKFVQDTATARLISMEVGERIKVLEQSLTKRKVAGAISLEDIKAGKGTGSIADFMNRDTAQKMLTASLETEGINARMEGAYAAVDEAFRLHPEPENAVERNKVIADITADMTDGARIRKQAQYIHTAETTARTKAEDAGKDVEFETWSAQIFDGTIAFHEIPAEARTYMGATRTAALLKAAEAMQHRDGFGEFDDSETEHKWMTMTAREKRDTNLNTAEWKPLVTHDLWSKMLAEQNAYKDAAAKPGKSPNIFGGDNADEVMRDILTGPNSLFEGVPKPGTEDARRYAYLSRKVDRALKDESLAQYLDTKDGKLLPQRIDEITAQVIGRVVYVEDWGRNTRTLSTALTPKQAASGAVYVDIDAISSEPAPTDSMGRPQNMEQYLRNIAGKDVSTRTIEKAYYLWISGDAAAAEALLTE